MASTSTFKCPRCGHSPCDVIEEKDVWHSHREVWLRCPKCKHVFRVEISWDKIERTGAKIGRRTSVSRTLKDIVAM